MARIMGRGGFSFFGIEVLFLNTFLIRLNLSKCNSLTTSSWLSSPSAVLELLSMNPVLEVVVLQVCYFKNYNRKLDSKRPSLSPKPRGLRNNLNLHLPKRNHHIRRLPQRPRRRKMLHQTQLRYQYLQFLPLAKRLRRHLNHKPMSRSLPIQMLPVFCQRLGWVSHPFFPGCGSL